MSASAYQQEFSEAYVYDACNPPMPADEETTQSYIEGYGDGMDVNLQVEGGVCYQTDWEKELLAEAYE